MNRHSNRQWLGLMLGVCVAGQIFGPNIPGPPVLPELLSPIGLIYQGSLQDAPRPLPKGRATELLWEEFRVTAGTLTRDQRPDRSIRVRYDAERREFERVEVGETGNETKEFSEYKD